MSEISKERRSEIIVDVASRVGSRPEWLDALINFETGGTYSPLIKNPRSSARGLIQVTNTTAQDVFGVSDSLALVSQFSDFESQMYNVVLPYLQQRQKIYHNGAPLDTQKSLYMAVFYPAYMDDPIDKPFPPSVVKSNPGIHSPRDYIQFVNARIKEKELHFSKTLPALTILLLMGAGVYILIKRS